MLLIQFIIAPSFDTQRREVQSFWVDDEKNEVAF